MPLPFPLRFAALALALVLAWPLTPHAQTSAQAQAPAQAQAQTLNEPAQRISDEAIHADYAGYAAQQRRIQALNDSGRHRVASYSLAKAQCWLDVSFHEYSRNDRSAFPQQALTESFRITDFLARGGEPASAENPARQTPLVNDAARLRPDLWALADELKRSSGWRCAEQLVACGEVELVHGGNEFKQQQWRHAKPYVQIAEDRLGEAQDAAKACAAPPPAAPAAPPPAPIVAAPPAPPEPVPMTREANVLFNFDKRDIANVRPLSKDRLDALIGELKAGRIVARRIVVTGHADISNHTGNQQYNVLLARDRAETIRRYLLAEGLAGEIISVDAKADTQQVAACDRRRASQAEYEECLLPNRRVEVLVEGLRGPR